MHRSVSAAEPSNDVFGFNRKSSPNIALYEWHMCFIVDGTTYKGWRGFDPGPNTSLRVNCFIPREQLAAHSDRYLCETEETLHAGANYSEYALHCWSKETCRRFETESAYNLFLRRGATNVALYRKVPSKDVRETTVNYEYLDDSRAEELRNSWIREAKKSCSKLDGKNKNPCLQEVAEIDSSLRDEDWRYQLTEKALVDSFPELGSQKVISEDTSHLDYATTFIFSPYEAKDNLASFYTVVCPAELRQAKAAACRLISNQAFYSNDPSEYFDIESTSDVKTALWAHSAHKKVKVVSENEWMARRLKDARRVNLIEIDGMIAKFSYGSDGCWHQVFYRIVGNNEKLEFLKTNGGSCI